MSVLINPGSGPVSDSGSGWTNTAEGARQQALRWLAGMVEEGIRGVVLLPGSVARDGAWTFRFQHAVTGKVVELETHGVDDMGAYVKDRVFPPRTYWNGSSTSTPEIEDWAADGFEVIKTLMPKRPRRTT